MKLKNYLLIRCDEMSGVVLLLPGWLLHPDASRKFAIATRLYNEPRHSAMLPVFADPNARVLYSQGGGFPRGITCSFGLVLTCPVETCCARPWFWKALEQKQPCLACSEVEREV